MRVVFMGTPEFAAVSLNALLAAGHEVAAVVTAPDKPKGRGLKLHPSAVKCLAVENNIPVLQPVRLSDEEFVAKLRVSKADIFVVVAFRILPRAVFMIPDKGTINVHASLLPKYRGAAPINWALMNGDQETGITTMRIDEKVDTGNIYLQEKIPITENMSAGELHDALALLGSELLIRTLKGIEKGTLLPHKQADELATNAPKITKEMCQIDFNRPAVKVHDQIRGLSPYPGAYCYHKDHLIKIFQSRVGTEISTNSEPGTISRIGKNFFTVGCASGSVRILEVQLSGKKRLNVTSFFNGYTMAVGDRLT